MIRFEYMDRTRLPELSGDMFEILATNMSAIAPTGNAYKEDMALWYNAVSDGLQRENRKIILILLDNIELIGFFQYYVSGNLFMMEEIQLSKAWQGKENIFRRVYEFVVPQLSGIKTVEAYANKRNEKSQRILEKLGLVVIGENKNGNSYHYSGLFSALMEWLNSK